MKKYAVIMAGGSGLRMGTQVPKQFLLLQGKPVLWHTLTVFLDAYEDMEIILVLPEEHLETGRTILSATRAPHRIRMVTGGATRFDSVKNGLHALSDAAGLRRDGKDRVGTSPGAEELTGHGKDCEESLSGEAELIEREKDTAMTLADAEGLIGDDKDFAGTPPGAGAEDAIIFVHDGVRCLLTTDLVHRCYEQAVKQGAAIPVVDSKDSVRLITAGGNEAIDRTRVKLVQTPQTFRSGILLSSFSVPYQEKFTDEATVVEASGHIIYLVEGELNNIKITTPVDLILAGQILTSSSK